MRKKKYGQLGECDNDEEEICRVEVKEKDEEK